jgi:phosphoadenosine phosphosulfate reductase
MSKDLFGHDKVEEAIERLRIFEPPEGYFGAFSGGKDSCVIKELCKMIGTKVDWHYNVTTIDPPELIYFIRKHHSDVVWERPEKPFLARMIEKGFPMRINRWCCAEYKENSGSGRRVLTGIRSAESQKRAGRKMVEQCFKDSSKTYVNIIIDWTEQDVWVFIKERNVPYCCLYDEGFKRIGCVMCPYNYSRAVEAERWPRMKANFERAFIKLYEKNHGRPSYQRWRDGREMFEWWLSSRGGGKGNPDQTVMFE